MATGNMKNVVKIGLVVFELCERAVTNIQINILGEVNFR